MICSKVLESEMAPFSVLTAGTDATTMAESVRDAIWRVKSARRVARAPSRKSAAVALSNPSLSTVSVYRPGRTFRNSYSPSSFEVAAVVVFSSTSVRASVAPATAAPDGSRTMPKAVQKVDCPFAC